MVKHIVMWKVAASHDGMDRQEILEEMKDRIEALKEAVPVVRELEVGIDVNRSAAAYDIVLYSAFDNQQALDAYQVHPAHEAVKKFVGTVTTERAVVDYDV